MSTYVLVHGAWHTGAELASVASPIRAAGHQVHTPTLAGNRPGDSKTTGLKEAIQSVVDYLAEITMSLLARARQKTPSGGFVPDFVTQFGRTLARDIAAKKIRVVANAGGVNPLGCRDALLAELAKVGGDTVDAGVYCPQGGPVLDQTQEGRQFKADYKQRFHADHPER